MLGFETLRISYSNFSSFFFLLSSNLYLLVFSLFLFLNSHFSLVRARWDHWDGLERFSSETDFLAGLLLPLSFSGGGHSLSDVLGGAVGEAVAELDNVGHVAHVQASRGHGAGHQEPGGAGAEVVEGGGPLLGFPVRQTVMLF